MGVCERDRERTRVRVCVCVYVCICVRVRTACVRVPSTSHIATAPLWWGIIPRAKSTFGVLVVWGSWRGFGEFSVRFRCDLIKLLLFFWDSVLGKFAFSLRSVWVKLDLLRFDSITL